MYESPVNVIYGQLRTELEGTILKAIQDVGVVVDKEELIKALKYDRFQYSRGYEDGKADAMDSIVRCKDCKNDGMCSIQDAMNWTPRTEISDYFCSFGERKDND